jgi:hypothetical protein
MEIGRVVFDPSRIPRADDYLPCKDGFAPLGVPAGAGRATAGTHHVALPASDVAEFLQCETVRARPPARLL